MSKNHRMGLKQKSFIDKELLSENYNSDNIHSKTCLAGPNQSDCTDCQTRSDVLTVKSCDN